MTAPWDPGNGSVSSVPQTYQPQGSKPAPTPPPAKAPTPAPTPSLSSSQQSIYDLMSATLQSWGLGTLASDLKNLILKGDTSPDTLALALSQTDAYKQRFAGNAERVKNGLSELTPAQYIAVEEQYQNVLQSYGLPKGFYDSHEDFVDLIGKNIDPTELQSRAQIAHDYFTNAPAATKALWSSYGFTSGDVIAGLLDPNVATKVLEDRANQVGIGGAAAAQGLGVNQIRAQQLQQAGVTLAGAQKAYAQIAAALPTDQAIAHRFGTTFDQTQEENDLLLGQSDATIKRQTLYNEEQALFKGGSGADSNALGVRQSY